MSPRTLTLEIVTPDGMALQELIDILGVEEL